MPYHITKPLSNEVNETKNLKVSFKSANHPVWGHNSTYPKCRHYLNRPYLVLDTEDLLLKEMINNERIVLFLVLRDLVGVFYILVRI